MVVTPESRIARVECWVRAGSRFEADEERGAAHFLEHILLKGTHNLSLEAFRRRLNELGAQSNATTNRKRASFFIEAPVRNLEAIVSLLADIVSEVVVPLDVFENEKAVINEEYYMMMDTNIRRIYNAYYPVLFEGHPLAKSPFCSPQQTTALQLNDVVRFHQKMYQPSRMKFIIASSEHEDRMRKLADTYWGKRNSATKESQPDDRVTFSPLGVHELTYPVESPYGGCIINYRIPSGLSREEQATFSLLRYAIGGGKYNLLVSHLRDQRGISYSPYASLEVYSDAAEFYLEARTTKPEQVRRVMEEIMAQPLSVDDFTKAKEGLLGEVELMGGDFRKTIAFIGNQSILMEGNRFENVDDYALAIKSVSLQEIERTRKEYLAEENCLVVIIRPNPKFF